MLEYAPRLLELIQCPRDIWNELADRDAPTHIPMHLESLGAPDPDRTLCKSAHVPYALNRPESGFKIAKQYLVNGNELCRDPHIKLIV